MTLPLIVMECFYYIYNMSLCSLRTFGIMNEILRCLPINVVRSIIFLWNTGRYTTVLKLRQFAVPETCENQLGLVNSCVYCAPRPVKFTRSCLTQWVSKLPGSFNIHRVRQCLVNEVLVGIKDLLTFEMSVKLKSNFYVGPINIFLTFDTDTIS